MSNLSIDALNDLLGSTEPEKTDPVVEETAAVEETLSSDDLSDLDADLDAELDLLGASPAPIADSDAELEAMSDDVAAELESKEVVEPVTELPQPTAEPIADIPATPIPQKRARPAMKNPVSEFATDETLEAMNATRDNVDELINSLPVKAREKAKNMIHFLENGVELSIYTRIGLRELITETLANSGDLCQSMMNYTPRPYPYKTASTQAGQLMALFPAMGIAERKGNVLHLNRHSPFVLLFNQLDVPPVTETHA